MKRILFITALVLGLGGVVSAQTSGNGSAKSTSVNSSRAKTKMSKTKKAQAGSLNERKNYNWKDGQQATPTGHEATGTNGSAASVPKDSATVHNDSKRHKE